MSNQAELNPGSGVRVTSSSQSPDSATPGSQPGNNVPTEDVAIPKSRMDEAVGKARDETKRAERLLAQEREARMKLEGRLEALEKSATPAQAPPKTYSRTELQALVDEGKITEAQRDDQLQLQQEDRLRTELEARLQLHKQEVSQGQSVEQQIVAYKERMPEVMDTGSELRARFSAKYQELVNLGQPQTNSTELVALQMIVGPLDKIPEKTATSTETHAGTGSGDGAAGSEAISGSAPKGLNADQKAHYEWQIGAGLYTGWDDPSLKDEVKWASQTQRMRG